jgi:hypothetical protein
MPADYVVVSTVQGQFAEQQVRAFLEAHGIDTHVKGETLRTTHGIFIDGLGAVDILVPADVVDVARELLARADRGEFVIDEPEEPAKGRP